MIDFDQDDSMEDFANRFLRMRETLKRRARERNAITREPTPAEISAAAGMYLVGTIIAEEMARGR